MDMTSTILLVDDYPDAVDVLAIYLRGEGFEVLTACDGEHALREARRVRPQLIVMDLEMPILSGYEVAARLRADAETRDIPLIAAGGINSLYTSCPIERAHRDIHAMRRHIVGQDMWLEDAGRVRLGGAPQHPLYAV